MKKILIIEDDKELNGLLCKILEDSGYLVQLSFTGIEGLAIFRAEPADLILLDIMLPYKSGDEVLREIRTFSNVPIIMITAKDLTRTKIDLLRLGADDYITKPFDVDEVLARVEAVLRRYNSTTNGVETVFLSYKDIVIDCESKRVAVSGKDISLTVTEYAILELLIKNPVKIFSKRNLFEKISGEEYLSDDNTMNVHISNLRQKLREFGKFEDYIETVYGMGYRLLKT